jgi:tetratricopeptide (TPR) repeat protein
LRLRPGDRDTLNSRGLVQLKRGAFDRAVADYAAAVAQDRKDADSLFGRGLARLRLGDLAGGEADIAAAGAIRPGIAEDYVGYGVAMVAAGGPPAQAAAATSADAAARRDYQLAAQVGTRAAWEAFLKAYPSGLHAELARAQLEKLGVAAPETTGALDREKAEKDRLAREQADRERVAAPVLTAELAPPPATAPSQPSPPLSGGALVEEIKKGLTRLGCYAGPIDDKWKTAATRSAVKKFAAAVQLAAASEKPTQDLLDAVRNSTGRVCPPACGPREVKRKGACVAKTCNGKLVLDDDGKCVKPDDKRAALPSAAGPAPQAARPASGDKK